MPQFSSFPRDKCHAEFLKGLILTSDGVGRQQKLPIFYIILETRRIVKIRPWRHRKLAENKKKQ